MSDLPFLLDEFEPPPVLDEFADEDVARMLLIGFDLVPSTGDEATIWDLL